MSSLTHRLEHWLGRTGLLSPGAKHLMTFIRKLCGRPHAEIIYLLDKGLIYVPHGTCLETFDKEHKSAGWIPFPHSLYSDKLQTPGHRIHLGDASSQCALTSVYVKKGSRTWLDPCEPDSKGPIQLPKPPNPALQDQQMKTEREQVWFK